MVTPANRAIRHIELDMLKGLAMVLVVVDHCGYPLPPVLDAVEVPAFFFISGTLFSPKSGWRDFVSVKTRRLVVPYFFMCLLFLVPFLLRDGWRGAGHTLSQVFLAPANYPMWFVKVLFWDTAILYSLHRWQRPAAMLAVGVVSVAAGAASAALAWPAALMLSGLPQSLVVFPLVYTGYVSARYVKSGIQGRKTVLAHIAVVVVCGLSAWLLARENIHLQHADAGASPLLFYLVTLCAVTAALAVLRLLTYAGNRQPETGNRNSQGLCEPLRYEPLSAIGRHSLTYLGTHALVILVCVEVLSLPRAAVLAAALLVPALLAPAFRRWLPRLTGYS